MSGEVRIRISADDAASPVIARVNSSLSGIAQTARGTLAVALGNVLASAAGAAARAISGLTSSAIQSYASHEMLAMSLQTLAARELRAADDSLSMSDALGLASDKARELLDWTQQLAIKSPFSQSGVADAFKLAMAYGFTTEEAKRLTAATIDYAAGAGLSSSAMSQIALALGQIKAKGKLAGQEVLQLTNAGLDVRGILADAFDVPTEKLVEMQEKGLIPANDAIEAIVSSLEKDFGGAAERASGTFSGLLSSLSDIKEVGLREFFGGVFQALQPLLDKVTSWLSGEGMNVIRDLGDTVGQFAQRAIEAGEAFYSGGLKPALEWIGQNGEIIKAALIGIGVAIMVNVLPAVVSVVVAAAPVVATFAAIAVAAGFLYYAWQSNLGGIRDIAAQAWSKIELALKAAWEWLKINIPAALDFLKKEWSAKWGAIKKGVTSYLNALKALFRAFRAALSGDWSVLGKLLQSAWAKIWDAIKGVALSIWGSISRAFSDFMSKIKSKLDEYRSKLESAWRELGDSIKRSWNDAWNAIVSILLSAWGRIKQSVSALINSIKDAFTKTDWGALGGNIVDKIKGAIEAGVNKMATAANSLIEKIKSTFSIANWATTGASIVGKIKDAIVFARDSISSAANSLIEKIKSTFSIASWATTGSIVVGKIKDAIIGARSSISGAVNSIIDKIKETFEGAKKWGDIGRGIISKIGAAITSSISNLVTVLKNAISGALSTVLQWLGIGGSSSQGMSNSTGGTSSALGATVLGPAAEGIPAPAVSTTSYSETVNNYYLTVNTNESIGNIRRDFELMRVWA